MEVDFSGIKRSVELRHEHGRPLHFPNRNDYVDVLIEQGFIEHGGDFSNRPELVHAVYLDWLKRGQVGCVFAQLLGRTSIRSQIRTIVLPNKASSKADAGNLAIQIDEAVLNGMHDPAIEAVTILLPNITTIEDLVYLVHGLSRTEDWKLENVVGWGQTLLNIGVRRKIEEATWAEILGMGPFANYFPSTRTCPITSLEVRTKAERAITSKSHPGEARAAHLAQVPTRNFLSIRWHKRLFETYTPLLKARILEGMTNDRRAKAAVTFTVPAVVWDQLSR
jgi:hypothetical protein